MVAPTFDSFVLSADISINIVLHFPREDIILPYGVSSPHKQKYTKKQRRKPPFSTPKISRLLAKASNERRRVLVIFRLLHLRGRFSTTIIHYSIFIIHYSSDLRYLL